MFVGVQMMKIIRSSTVWIAVAALLALPAQASAQDAPNAKTAPVAKPTGPVVFKAISALPQKGSDFNPQLRGGQQADPGQWLASLYVVFKVGDEEKSCTAALIGPEVMLTAAHCVPETGDVSFTYGDDPTYKTECKTHERYSQDASADFALCRLERPFKPPAGFKYESISGASMAKAADPQSFTVLGGFGCFSDDVSERAQATEGYFIGYAQIVETSDAFIHTEGPLYYAPQQVNNLITRYEPGDEFANVCPGDSGGPAFRLTGASGQSQMLAREIIGVNSRAFLNFEETEYRGSLLSATGGPDFRKWAMQWLKDEKLKACGLMAGVPACR
jgi:hypothetical protein